MKKRLLTILICAALTVQCSACGTSGNAETSQAPETAETTPQNDHSGIYGTAGEVSAYDTENSNYSLTVNAGEPVHEISDTLFSIFIEDINFAADGGLYAEMVQNRSFEFTKLASGNERHAWSDVGSITAAVRSEDGLNENNPNYMSLENSSGEKAGIANKGFLDGMAVTEGASYDVSAYIRGIDGYSGAVYFGITVDGETVAEEAVPSVTDEWHRYSVTLTSPVTADRNVKLQVLMDGGKLDIDFVSMFPQDTYKGRKNGLRKDLAEKLEALEPKFLRFPGGCAAEGYTLDLAYDWKDSIGVGSDGEPLVFGGVYGNIAARKQGQNIWTNEGTDNDPNPSYMSYGLGFYEYFLLAEDLGALPVPVLNCGMHCMAQGHGSEPAVNSEAFRAYIQDALDLVEFCRGDLSTKWGAVRITMGHPEPFELKYVGIGNENWGDTFFEKYRAFAEAFVQAKKENPDMYGDIRLIFTAGPDDGDSGHGMYMSAYK